MTDGPPRPNVWLHGFSSGGGGTGTEGWEWFLPTFLWQRETAKALLSKWKEIQSPPFNTASPIRVQFKKMEVSPGASLPLGWQTGCWGGLAADGVWLSGLCILTPLPAWALAPLLEVCLSCSQDNRSMRWERGAAASQCWEDWHYRAVFHCLGTSSKG